jgi:hypothetical protein
VLLAQGEDPVGFGPRTKKPQLLPCPSTGPAMFALLGDNIAFGKDVATKKDV